MAPDIVCDDQRQRSLFWNPQSRWLAGLSEPNIALVNDLQESDDVLLKKALRNLKLIAFVGIVEKMDASLQLLCRHLYWPMSLNIHKLNVNHCSNDSALPIPDSFLDIDRIVYQEAVLQLKEQLRHMPQGTSYRDPLEPILISADGPSSGALDSNWYEPEYDPGNGVWRWTGPGKEVTIRLDEVRSEKCDILLCVTGHTVAERLYNVSVCIGDWEPRLPSGVWAFEQGFCLSFVGLRNIHGGHLKILVGDVLCEPAGRTLGISFKHALVAPSISND